MSDQVNDDSATLDEIPAPDRALADLVVMINSTAKGEIGATLTVNGSVVSGDIISGERFFLGLQEEIRNASGADNRLADTWQPMVDAYRADREADVDFDAALKNTVFIHLRNAKVINGETSNVGFWRGRLESVDGWSIGRLDA